MTTDTDRRVADKLIDLMIESGERRYVDDTNIGLDPFLPHAGPAPIMPRGNLEGLDPSSSDE